MNIIKTIPKIIVIGGGVAGTEVGTYIGQKTKKPVNIIQIESDDSRRFGGWAFQSFPRTEKTNLSLEKMYLGDDPDDIIRWSNNLEARITWPEEFKNIELIRTRTFPRSLMKEYIMWRRNQVKNIYVDYTNITGEAVSVSILSNNIIEIELMDGRKIQGEQLVIASGSVTVKIPAYLDDFVGNPNVIIDPLTKEGNEKRKSIPKDAKVLILGTGLTGEEQANILLHMGHNKVYMLSRNGMRHYVYPRDQQIKPLKIDKSAFINYETLSVDALLQKIIDYFKKYLDLGYSPEDIHASLRPFWDPTIRHLLGRCKNASRLLYKYRRILAVQSIGSDYDVAEFLKQKEFEGCFKVLQGNIIKVTEDHNRFIVRYTTEDNDITTIEEPYDYIINAIGRNIIRHSIWENMLSSGFATKHLGIGVQVDEFGRLIDSKGNRSSFIYVVGMPRAGDHALRHGYLGNFAFNVPQVRAHCYHTADLLLKELELIF